jgi:hypothetical protein
VGLEGEDFGERVRVEAVGKEPCFRDLPLGNAKDGEIVPRNPVAASLRVPADARRDVLRGDDGVRRLQREGPLRDVNELF